MKKLCGVVLVLCFGLASAQTTDPVNANQDTPAYNDVSGTPYLFADWNKGAIRFSSGRVATQFKLKFDCITNQLMLQFDGNSFANQSKVREFVIYPKSGKDSLVFRRNFPTTEKGNEETFYEIIEEGKATLLLLHYKQITEEAQLVSKIIYRRIRDENAYYILKEKMMIELPADKTAIIEKLTDQSDKIRLFINEHQLKFRNKEDFKKLVVYYNLLL